MLLSSTKSNGIVKIDGKLAIVIDRLPEDSPTGFAEVRFEDGNRSFIWDKDEVEVEYLGQGKLTIVLDK